MKRSAFKSLWILILIAIMILPPLRAASATGYNYYTSIFIYKYPDKMEYEIGDSFDPAGMIIKGYVMQTDGTTMITTLGLNNMTVSPKTFTKAGWNEVTLTLKCMGKSGQMEPFSVKLNVKVKEEMEGDPPLYWTKSISANLSKTDYAVGDYFDQSTLTVWAYSEGNYPPEDEKWDCTAYVTKITPFQFTKVGEQYVTITANLTTEHSTADFTTKVKVNVHEKIKITKHPKGETVEEGGSCYFTVKGDNFDYLNWYFTKGNKVILGKFIHDEFPTLKVSGIYEKKLKLSNIPLELDGWSVYCEFFSDAESIESDLALITVTAKATPTPETTEAPTATPEPTATPVAETSAEPSAEPSEEPTADPTAAETLAPVAEATPAPQSEHVHSFDGVYRYDSKQHWLECACGEKTAVADHVVAEWTVLAEPSKDAPGVRRGLCAVCGAEVLESIPQDSGSGSSGLGAIPWLLYVGIGLAALALIGVVVSCIVFLGKRNKKED